VTRTWHNWARTVRCEPVRRLTPTNEADIAAAVALAGRRGLPVRAAGAGHSFNPLATSEGILLDLAQYRGVMSLDVDAGTVTVRSGTSMHEVNRVLERAGLAVANVGTLERQTIAGAVSTGNHGTGITHPPLSGEILALRIVTADGAIRVLDRASSPDMFRCAVTALGALGIITTVTLRCVPLFRLRVVERSVPLANVLEGFSEWTRSADHVSPSWLPWRDTAHTRSMSATIEPVTPGAGVRQYARTLSEVRCGLLGLAGHVLPRSVPPLTAVRGAGTGTGWARTTATGRGARPEQAYIDVSYRAFAFPQPVRFVAMEYAVPLDNVPVALVELRSALCRTGQYSPYSLLVRVGRKDDAPLSPAYGRPTGYINLTVPRTVSYLELLRVVECVLRELDGRPHWGKAHTATAEVLAPRYPEWETFQRVRAELDPHGRFSNDYLRRLLGPVRVEVAD
jgi:L-gulono-1,4-lactone dehydrogenase